MTYSLNIRNRCMVGVLLWLVVGCYRLVLSIVFGFTWQAMGQSHDLTNDATKQNKTVCMYHGYTVCGKREQIKKVRKVSDIRTYWWMITCAPNYFSYIRTHLFNIFCKHNNYMHSNTSDLQFYPVLSHILIICLVFQLKCWHSIICTQESHPKHLENWHIQRSAWNQWVRYKHHTTNKPITLLNPDKSWPDI